MIINYGYKDGSGEYFIVLDTDKCNGCGECVEVCPAGVLEMTTEFDPDTMDDMVIPHLTKEHAKKIKYSCAPCKPGQDMASSGEVIPPCIQACEPQAMTHSW
jgi:ferredoxin